MGSTWQLIDPEDFTTVRFDLNDGVNTSMGAGARIGGARRTSDIISPPIHDGDMEGAGKYGRVVSLLPLNLQASSADALVTLARSLGSQLRRGGAIKVKAEDQTDPVVYDFYPCDVPDLFNDNLPFYQASTGVGGSYRARVIVELPHHPTPRLATVSGTPATLDNSTGGGDMVVNNPGNVAGETKVSIDPAANLGGFILGIREKGNLTEFRTLYSRDATSWTELASDCSLTMVGGEDAVVCDFTDTTFHKLFRDARSVTDPIAAQGVFRAILRYQQTGGTTDNESEFSIQARYAFSDTEVLQGVLAKEVLDWRDVSTDGATYWDLGLVEVPAGVDTIIIDLWGRRREGDHDLACFKIDLVPADYYFAVGSTFRKSEWGHRFFPGRALDGTGDVRKERYRLNANGEIGHTDAEVLPAGIHRVRGRFIIHEPEDDSITSGANPTVKEIARLKVIADPEGTPTTRARRKVRNRRNNQVTRLTKGALFEVTSADVTAGMEFWFEAEHTAADEDGRRVLIPWFRSSFLQAVSSSDTLVIDNHPDPLQKDSRVESASATAFSFVVENELPLAPPGDSVWVFLWFGLPTDQGFEEIHPDGNTPLAGPAGLATGSLACDVTVDRIPRVTH
jgi:hypothetical protein